MIVECEFCVVARIAETIPTFTTDGILKVTLLTGRPTHLFVFSQAPTAKNFSYRDGIFTPSTTRHLGLEKKVMVCFVLLSFNFCLIGASAPLLCLLLEPSAILAQTPPVLLHALELIPHARTTDIIHLAELIVESICEVLEFLLLCHYL